MWVRVVVAIALLVLPAAAFAQTEKRIALVIGNKDYKAGVGALTNPLNDIRIVGQALKAVGSHCYRVHEESAVAAGRAEGQLYGSRLETTRLVTNVKRSWVAKIHR